MKAEKIHVQTKQGFDVYQNHTVFTGVLGLLAETSPDATMLVNGRGIIILWNTAAEKIFGYSREDIIGKPVTVVVPDECMDNDRKEFERLLSSPRQRVVGRRFETSALRKDGRVISVGVSLSVGTAGEEPCYCGVIRDLSEEKETAEQLDGIKKFYGSILDSIVTGVLVTDEKDIIFHVNSCTSRIMAFPKHFILGKKIIDTFPKASFDVFNAHYQKAKESLVPVRFSTLKVDTRQKDHRYFSGWVVPRVNDGIFSGMICTFAEVTQRKQVEDMLTESEERYRTAIEHSNDGIAILKNNQYLYVNKKFRDMFGYTNCSDIVGCPGTKVIHPDDRERLYAYHFARYNARPAPPRYEFTGIKKDGSAIQIEVSATMTTYKEEKVSIIFLRDITQRKKAEHNLLESEKQLRIYSNNLVAVEEEVRKRIAAELHDGIGQSLTAMKYIVENTVNLIGKGHTEAGVNLLKNLINTIRDTIAEVRRITVFLRPAIIDQLGIIATISWYCREFQKVYENIQIHTDIGVEEGLVPDRLKYVIYRVLQEALTNTAKHSNAEYVNISLVKRDTMIELSVKDYGSGFDMKKYSSADSYIGAFGLISMRERVELSGGTFILSAVRGEGTLVRAHWNM